jgi:hypothetical protein
MTEAKRFVRRNRVDERVAIGIAAVSGVIAATAGAEPTGSAGVDAVLVFLSVAAVVWASASAPWWASASACGVGAAIALQPVVAAIGLVGFIAGLVVGLRRQDQPELRAVVGGIAANVLIRSELDGFFGLSALIGISVLGALFLLGLRRRPSTIRRYGWITIASVLGLAVVAMLGLGIAVLSARPDLTNASRQSQAAIDSLNAGDYEVAAQTLQQASSSFGRADNRLGGLVALPSRLIPIVAQNVVAGADLSGAAQEATADAAAALGLVDAESLRLVDGAVDLEAVSAVEAPLVRVQDALADLSVVADDVESPWLLDRVQQELADLEADLDDNEPRLQNAIDAVRLAPQMLGADGERRYLILFTTPSEARGLGGFVGNYAEVTADNGKVEVLTFARRSDLDAVAKDGAVCTGCPQELLDRYGRFGLNSGPNGAVQNKVWTNITMPSHFPYVAESASILYPQSGGVPVDGVFVLDPYVVQELMQFTGPIDVPELGVTVEPDDAAQFIIEDQYLLAGNEGHVDRIDALQTLGERVVVRLLSGSLPRPAELSKVLSPLVEERRLLFWTDEAVEQDLLDRTGLLGSLPELGDDGGFSVSVTNASGSKIEIFLERTVDVRIEEDLSGNRELIADVTLTNGSPASGLPNYVIGNAVGLPDGWSRLFVSFYGPPSVVSVTLDGSPIEIEPATEAGWSAYGDFVDIPPGGTVHYTLVFALEPADPDSGDSNGPVEWFQPLVARE